MSIISRVPLSWALSVGINILFFGAFAFTLSHQTTLKPSGNAMALKFMVIDTVKKKLATDVKIKNERKPIKKKSLI